MHHSLTQFDGFSESDHNLRLLTIIFIPDASEWGRANEKSIDVITINPPYNPVGLTSEKVSLATKAGIATNPYIIQKMTIIGTLGPTLYFRANSANILCVE